tara:strand:- start:564 stop:749 length:186 start_codon:yes stop_codon:yes gene_type:complete
MLSYNQIKRLILHTQELISKWDDKLDSNELAKYEGFISALKLVLNVDPETINNNPIKESVK